MGYKHIYALHIAALLICISTASWSKTVTGKLEVGGQGVHGNTGSSKFDEYRDIPHGLYIGRIGLNVNAEEYYLRLNGLKPAFKDQKIILETGYKRKHKLSLTYDQIPHNFSNTAKTFLSDSGNGTFVLPDSLQTSLQTSTTNAAGLLSAPPLVPVRLERRKANLSYMYSPSAKWRINMGYAGEKREGTRTIGVTYGHGQIEEALEPINYMISDLNLGVEYTGRKAGFKAGYSGSVFNNGTKALTVDNPFQLADGALSASGSSTPGKARLALPPDNQTHQVNFAFNTQLPAKSNLSANLSFAAQLQNESFLPLTVNAVILNDPRLPSLSRNSLNGKVYTLNGGADWNLKPWKKFAMNVHGKQYNVHNRTPRLALEQYVSYDTVFSTRTPAATFNPTRSRTNMPIDYKRTNLGTDFYYTITKPLTMKLSYDWNLLDRDFRDVNITKEDVYTLSFNIAPRFNLAIRPSYQYARRTSGNYSPEHVAEETFPLGEGTGLGVLEEQRKFDEAGDKRNKASLRADWDGLFLSFALDSGLTRNDYVANYGNLDDETIYHSVYVSFSPSDRHSFYTDYTWELLKRNIRSRYRQAGLDVTANDWQAFLEDRVDTINLGVTSSFLRDKLDTDIGWSMSYAKGIQHAVNPNTVQGTSAQTSSSTGSRASDLPNTYNRLHNAHLLLRYHFLKEITGSLRYDYERYTEIDWAQDNLNVWQSTWNKSVFLAQRQPRYNSHIVALSLSYSF